jgi:hypothetical protein
LQPGLHGPGFTAPFTLTPAPDIPPGAIVIAVPLYPAAVPTAERESIPALDYSLTPYLKSDGAAYLLPADPATALAWYRQGFAARTVSVHADCDLVCLDPPFTMWTIRRCRTSSVAPTLGDVSVHPEVTGG